MNKEIELNMEQMTFYQMKELFKLLIEVLKEEGINLIVNDEKVKIVGALKKHLKEQ